MIYIQRVRNNDIGDDYGKQVELGKVFMSHHSWEAGEIPVKITFCSLSEYQQDLDGTKLKTTFKVRGDERGGDRIGVDCKEYANEDRVCVLKQFLTNSLHLTPNEDYFILEDVGTDGKTFKLYAIHNGDIPASIILDKFKGQIIDMDETSIKEEQNPIDQPLQLIYYGAPGTGKSFTINKVTDENNSVRTTFHPDSDYAGFVGAYKPTMASMPINAFVGTTVHHAKNAENEKAYERKIVYKYVPQAFLKAYVEAWKRYSEDEDNPYYLVIEEINRGNCAQIFGDLFQLLDRNNQGCSSYVISADEDIAQFLRDDDKGFKGFDEIQKDLIRKFVLKKDSGTVEHIGPSILDGSKLLLPPNMRIWATMNTSDQSLFPIDSAFKRRWNWEYVPIQYDPVDNRTGEHLSWKLEVNGRTYSWGSFLDYINPKILEITQSEDKQMGYFFAKPDKKSKEDLQKNDTISTKVFVNKVLFYLWTDVFKDYDLTQEPFVYEDEEGKKVAYRFTDFFSTNGADALTRFIDGFKLPVIGEEGENNTANTEEATKRIYGRSLVVKFPDGTLIKGDTQFDTYIQALEKIGLDNAARVIEKKGYSRNQAPLISKQKSEAIENSQTFSYVQRGEYFIIKGIDTMEGTLKGISKEIGLDLNVYFE